MSEMNSMSNTKLLIMKYCFVEFHTRKQENVFIYRSPSTPYQNVSKIRVFKMNILGNSPYNAIKNGDICSNSIIFFNIWISNFDGC
jgi:hypothetical protein